MVTVAIAGGTGGVGRAIVNSIVANGKHKAIVLARRVSSPAKYFGFFLIIMS
jgi:uncharacterized protein YbjT (DUF2867 family)